ncbi:MAG: beta-hydroxyacyl-ACP dehydratase [Verrucomicrobia bacterium]|nr:beta-hydroxyacyl-ACP dehydratase [Verrucomicrobiota bacterium]MDA1065779.1 beta-hydroxyacyl-ACP dehydratase [Verrucomicrobiota bacterium]
MPATSEVLRSIPHRPPFLFVDEVLEMRDDGATTRLTVKENFEFFEGHYPGNPIMPGVIICEAVFQSAAVFLVKKYSGNYENKKVTPVLGRILNARFREMVKPGDILTIEVSIQEKVGMFFICKGVVKNGEKRALNIEYTLALKDED